MTREELRDYVEEQRSLNMIPYHVYSTLIDGIDTLEQESTTKNDLGVDCVSNDMDSLEIEIKNYLENHPDNKDLMRVLLYYIEDKKELESE